MVNADITVGYNIHRNTVHMQSEYNCNAQRMRKRMSNTFPHLYLPSRGYTPLTPREYCVSLARCEGKIYLTHDERSADVNGES